MSHNAKGAFVLVERAHKYGGDQIARVLAVRGQALHISKFMTRGMRWARSVWIVERDVAGTPDDDDHRLALAKASLA